MRIELLKISSLLAMCILFFSCEKKSEKYSVIPELTYGGISKQYLDLKTDTGDWIMHFNFVDGDGDLGLEPNDTAMSITVTNDVTGDIYKFQFPYVPEGSRGGEKFLKGSGNIELAIQSFMIPREEPADRVRDTFVYSLSIVDKAGNVSNTIKSDSVYISK